MLKSDRAQMTAAPVATASLCPAMSSLRLPSGSQGKQANSECSHRRSNLSLAARCACRRCGLPSDGLPAAAVRGAELTVSTSYGRNMADVESISPYSPSRRGGVVKRALAAHCMARKDVQGVGRPQSSTSQAIRLGFTGGGIYFFWQLGVVQGLREHYDLTDERICMVGASSGALCATLAACDVQPERVLQTAYELSMREGIWERPLGVAGIWGQLVYEWLDELLPEAAAKLLRSRVEIVIGQFPAVFQQFSVADFADKDDVIQANMASVHVPFFLDTKPLRPYRGRQCLDGSLADFLNNQNSELLTLGSTLVFDYSQDPAFQGRGRFDFLRLRSYEEVQQLMAEGRAYALQLRESKRLPAWPEL